MSAPSTPETISALPVGWPYHGAAILPAHHPRRRSRDITDDRIDDLIAWLTVADRGSRNRPASEGVGVL